MTKEELFKKYFIDETHAEYSDMIDNWNGVEIYRVMHGGELPNSKDASTKYVLYFLDKTKNDTSWMVEFMRREDWSSLYLTAKRSVYRYAEMILKEMNS